MVESEQRQRSAAEEKKRDDKPKTGTQTTWAAFFDDRFDKFEPWVKIAVLGAAVLYFFKHQAMERGTLQNWERAKTTAILLFEHAREDGGPFSNWIGENIVVKLEAFRARQQEKFRQEEARRTAYWRQSFWRRLGRMFSIKPAP